MRHWTDGMPSDLRDPAKNAIAALDLLMEEMRVRDYIPCDDDLRYIRGEVRRAIRTTTPAPRLGVPEPDSEGGVS